MSCIQVCCHPRIQVEWQGLPHPHPYHLESHWLPNRSYLFLFASSFSWVTSATKAFLNTSSAVCSVASCLRMLKACAILGRTLKLLSCSGYASLAIHFSPSERVNRQWLFSIIHEYQPAMHGLNFNKPQARGDESLEIFHISFVQIIFWQEQHP